MIDGADWLNPNGVADKDGTKTKETFLDEDATDPGDISAYAGGNKEDDTRDWDYVNAAGPNPKTDFRHIMAHARVVGNSAIAYITPKDMLDGRQPEIHAERDRKLEAARKQRQIRRQQAA